MLSGEKPFLTGLRAGGKKYRLYRWGAPRLYVVQSQGKSVFIHANGVILGQPPLLLKLSYVTSFVIPFDAVSNEVWDTQYPILNTQYQILNTQYL